jgi:hypothetical protein
MRFPDGKKNKVTGFSCNFFFSVFVALKNERKNRSAVGERH